MRERSNEIKEIINANDVKDMCGKHGLAVVRSCVDKGKERKKFDICYAAGSISKGRLEKWEKELNTWRRSSREAGREGKHGIQNGWTGLKWQGKRNTSLLYIHVKQASAMIHSGSQRTTLAR